MKIIIDERESSLYSGSCSLLENSSFSHISILKEVLPLGDILIQDDQDIPLILIERKSINDLLASIKDGRYEEQSYRLINSTEFPVKQSILYIIEGMFTYHQDKKTVLSAMTSLQFFKGFSVQRTCSILETAEYIIHMTDKIYRDLKKGKVFAFQSREQNPTEKPLPYCTVVKKVKKDNINSQNMGEILLCQIPGISSTAAIAILKHTNGSFLQLLEILKTNPSELNTITVGEKGRKINKSIIEKMSELLLV